MKTYFIVFLIIGLLISQNLFADSPLTSTEISRAYKDSKIVQLASRSEGRLNIELMNYLNDSKKPIDLKIALINELGWGFDGQNNSLVFSEYLKRNNLKDINEASADVLICFAYLKALDNYFDVKEAIIYAQKAKSKNEKSYTINIICALIEAQKVLHNDWCEVYNLTNNLRMDDALIKDMKEEASEIIFEYMDLYKDDCETTATASLEQDDELTRKQIQSIQKLIDTFKTNNKAKIADLIDYPIKREYPLKDVKDKNDFIQRFDDIFDKELLDRVSKSKIDDWSIAGWEGGIMLDHGIIWIDENGKIVSINHMSPREEQLLANAIQADKDQLPKSLQNFDKPVYLIFTKNYKIRIDEQSGDSYRYAAWKIKNQKIEPEIILEKGVMEFQGTIGNHTITFNTSGYTYIVFIDVDTADATLEVVKQGKTLLTEEGKVKID
ncbi:hypothetical protein WG947_10950 [Pontibacter sp. H259]|uniref:hypothetical protein n=1 Tax=Pontibacter sp. H259 TaxID=3133421 RepID=UPI0030C26D0A